MNSIYQCPVCKKKLEKINKSFICDQNHSYDISREGYVNLLLANQKGTKDPGDSKFMVDNREKFLAKGYYNSLVDEINKILLPLLTAPEDSNACFNILDVGSGVGTYSGELQKFLKNKNFEKQVQLWGIDISKPAVQKAAKKYAEIYFSIGSNFHLPYLNESVDIIFSVFSPFDSKELLRVLKPGGKILLVRPGQNHLQELAALIYEKAKLQGNASDLSENLNASIIEKYQLEYKIKLENNDEVMSLVAMTPYYWHLSPEKKTILATIKKLTVSVDFQISLFRKV